MLNWFRTRNVNARKAKELYGAVVAAARQPEFYREYGVPDTLNGRYEMIVLALFQLLERLRAEGTAAEELSRLTLEAFFTDMDDCMREIGVGDLTVPKKVKKAAAGFYERTKTYRAALDAGDKAAMATAIESFVTGQDVMSTDPQGQGKVQASIDAKPASVASDSATSAPDTTASTAAPISFDKLADHAFRQRDALAEANAETVIAGQAFVTSFPM